MWRISRPGPHPHSSKACGHGSAWRLTLLFVVSGYASRALMSRAPGRMTMIDTLYDAHYGSREKLAWEFARILNEEARELEAAGVDIIQFDEPAFNVFFDEANDWGMQRTLVQNLVTGVTTGFSKKLVITGVGYRAAAQGKTLKLQLGYSHDVNIDVPEGIEVKTPDATTVEISGSDKQKVGQLAAEIRRWRKPEPYKGKGIKYDGEFIFRKEGKKK